MRLHQLALSLRLFTPVSWFVSGLATVVALILIGIPTSIINNPFFVRMTPVRSYDYVIWAISGILIGLIAGSFVAARRSGSTGKTLSGGLLSYFAVGCPVCNKLVLLLLGTSGALTFFAPIQLYLGIASVLLLGWALLERAKSLVSSCAVAGPGAQDKSSLR